MKKFFLIIVLLTGAFKISNAQFFPRFSIAGGPIVGWQMPNVNDLNNQIDQIGVPKFSTSGFFTVGGGGFVDIPWVRGLRIGGMGIGFTAEESATLDTLEKSVEYSFGMGGLSVEYVMKVVDRIDFTFGGLIGIGSHEIKVYQSNSSLSDWTANWEEIQTSSSSQNIARNYYTKVYSFQPQVGFGFSLTKILYAKLNAGYLFSVQGDWKVDNDIVVKNVPDGIKPDGFIFNFGINLGLFIQ